MNISPKFGLWITTFLWVGVVIGLWAKNQYQLTHGKEILLKTVPVDPRDLFRGDYVVLRYEISSINLDRLGQTEQYFRKNSTVYVSLKEQDGFWQATHIRSELPKEGVFIRGRVARSYDKRIEIEYGIESYFVPEGKGKEIEQEYAEGNLAVLVSVSPYGKGMLKSLIIKGTNIL